MRAPARGLHITGGTTPSDTGIHGSTNEHTGDQVALFAFGPGAEAFGHVLDNTELPKLLLPHFDAAPPSNAAC